MLHVIFCPGDLLIFLTHNSLCCPFIAWVWMSCTTGRERVSKRLLYVAFTLSLAFSMHETDRGCYSDFSRMIIIWTVTVTLSNRAMLISKLLLHLNVTFITYRVTQALSHILIGLQIVSIFKAILGIMSYSIVS